MPEVPEDGPFAPSRQSLPSGSSIDLVGTLQQDSAGVAIPKDDDAPDLDLLGTLNRESENGSAEQSGAFDAIRRESKGVDPARATRILNTSIKTAMPEDLVAANLEEIEEEISRADFDQKILLNSPKLAQWLTKSAPTMAATIQEAEKLGTLETLLRRPYHLWPKPDAVIEAEAKALAETKPKGRTWQANYIGDLASRRAEEAYIRGTDPEGAFAAIGSRFRENPMFFLPFVSSLPEVERGARIYEAAKALETNSATHEQMDFLIRAARMEEAARLRGTTTLGKIGAILAELPAFGGEFVMTAGVYAGAKAGATKVTTGMAKGWMGQVLQKAIAAGAGAAAQTAAMAPIRIGAETVRRMTPEVVLTSEDAAKIEPVIVAEGDGFTEAFAKAAGSAYIETISERSGFLLEKLTGPLKRVVTSRWLALHPESGVTGFLDELRKFGWNGPIEEMLEERVGEALRAGVGIENYVPPTAEQIAVELVAFSVPGAPALAIGVVNRAARPNRENQRAVRAVSNSEMLKTVADTVKETNLAKESPGSVEDLAGALAEGQPSQTLYQSAQTFKDYLESKGVDARAFAGRLLGDPKAYDDALATGGDFQIPMSRYVAAIVPSEHVSFFQDEIRVGDPGEMNGREGKEIAKRIKRSAELAKKAPEAPPAVSVAFEQEVQSVRSNVSAALQEAGMTPQDADLQAEVYASRIRRRAQIRGESPRKLFDALKLSIRRRTGEEVQGVEVVPSSVPEIEAAVEAAPPVEAAPEAPVSAPETMVPEAEKPPAEAPPAPIQPEIPAATAAPEAVATTRAAAPEAVAAPPAGRVERRAPALVPGVVQVEPGAAERVRELEEAETPETRNQTIIDAIRKSKMPVVQRMLLKDLEADPDRFQYKLDAKKEKGGAGKALRGIKEWLGLSGGGSVLGVWRDPADGKVYVVNGHHRRQRLLEHPEFGVKEINVVFYDVPTAEDAKIIGAIVNISEERGTPIDAADLFRSLKTTPEDLEMYGLSFAPDARNGRLGIALANLHPAIYSDVKTGKMTVGRGAAIGKAKLSGEEQLEVLKMVRSRKGKMTDAQVGELAELSVSAPKGTVTAEGILPPDIFKTTPEEKKLLVEKAILTAGVRGKLTFAKNLHGLVSRQRAAQELERTGTVVNVAESKDISEEAAQLLEVFDALKVQVGPISDILNQETKKIGEGKDAKRAVADAFAAIEKALPDEIRKRAPGAGVSKRPRRRKAGGAPAPVTQPGAAPEQRGAVEGEVAPAGPQPGEQALFQAVMPAPSFLFDPRLGRDIVADLGTTKRIAEAGYILPNGVMVKAGEPGEAVRRRLGIQNPALLDRQFRHLAGAAKYESGTLTLNFIPAGNQFVPTEHQLDDFITRYRLEFPGEPLLIRLEDPDTGEVLRQQDLPTPSIAGVMEAVGEIDFRELFQPEVGRQIQNPPPLDRSKYYPIEKVYEAIGGTYFKGEEKIARSIETPVTNYIPPVGTWLIDESYKGPYGHEISQLRTISLDEIEPTELDEKGRLDPIKREYVDKYREWLEAGLRPPPINVVETDRGNLRITDGHRRYVTAKALGRTTIEAIVSPLMDHPEGLREAGSGRIIRVGATFEAMRDRSDLRESLNPAALFQPEEAGQKRGAIRFGPGGINIDLFKKADRSTFLHETGHLWMREIAEDERVLRAIDPAALTPEQQRFLADADAVKKFLGVETLEGLSTDNEEKWARAAEAYFMEGKAPSSALRVAFARFRAWLTRVYKNLLALNVELTEDVRGVMDRLLATESEISEAEATQNRAPLFPDPAAAGMTPTQAAEYEAAVLEARQASEDALMDSMMAVLRRRRSPEFKDAEAKIRAEVEKEVNASPLYRALAAFQNGMTPEGTPLPEGTVPAGVVFKINRKASEGIVSPGKLKAIEERYEPGIFVADGGIEPEVAASLFGFENAKALFDAAATTIQRETAIRRLTDERMRLARPDLFEEPTKEDALEAIHNDKSAKKIRIELEYLASTRTKELKGAVRILSKRVSAKAAVEQARSEAARIIGNLPVRGLIPGIYMRAEANAAREAGAAFTRGDYEAALDAKVRELVNHELYRMATAARKNVKDALADFKVLNKPDETLAKSRDMNFVNAARAIAGQFEIGTTRAEKSAEAYLDQVRRYDADAYRTLSALIRAATASPKPYKEMTYDEFSLMADVINGLWEQSLRVRQVELQGKKTDLKDLVAEMQEQIGTLVTKEGAAKPDYRKAAGFWENTKAKLLNLKANLTRVESWSVAMDAGADKRTFFNSIFLPVSQASAKARLRYSEELRKLREIVKPLEGTLFGDPIAAPELGPGAGFRNRAELLGAILHSGNKSNLAKLLRGYGWGDYNEEGELETFRWDNFVRRAQRDGLVTKQDYDIIQQVWDLMNSLLPDSQKAHKELYGMYFGEIEASPIETPWGTYRGGYAPAVVDYTKEPDAAVKEDPDAVEDGDVSFMFASTGRGFTRQRIEGYARPLKMDFSLVAAHLEKVTRFIHLQPAVKDINRIVWDYGFSDSLKKLDPVVRTQVLVPWLQRAAQQKVVTPSRAWDGWKVWKELRARSGMNIMFVNAINTLQQYTGLSATMALVKPRHLRNGIATYLRSPKDAAALIQDKSEFMKTFMLTNVIEVQREVQDLFTKPTIYATAKDFFEKHAYFFQVFTQGHVNTITWLGAYEQAVETGVPEADAVIAADSAVRRTQGSFNPEDISKFEAGSPFMRLFTMFYSYYNMQLNLLGSEFVVTMRSMGLKTGAGRLIYVFTLGYLVPSIVSELIRLALVGEDDKDDDDSYLNDILRVTFVSPVRSGVSLLPFGQTTLSFFDIFKAGRGYYDDRITVSPAVSQAEAAGRGIRAIGEGAAGKELTGRDVRDILTALGLITGFPVFTAAGRPLGYLRNVQIGKEEPEDAADVARGLVTGR